MFVKVQLGFFFSFSLPSLLKEHGAQSLSLLMTKLTALNPSLIGEILVLPGKQSYSFYKSYLNDFFFF